MTLFYSTVKLAYEKPSLRKDLLPLLRQSANEIRVEEGGMKDLLGLAKNQKLSEFGNPRLAVDKIISRVGPKQASEMINWAANINPESEFLEEMQDYMRND